MKGGVNMAYRVRLAIDPNAEEEIVIRCKTPSEEILKLQAALTGGMREIELLSGDEIYFIETKSILFFETDGNKTAAHTKTHMYYTDLKLYELEELLPRSFMRVSKSCIANTMAISSIRKEITGICEARFADTGKKIFISRSYYKAFKDKINETRLKL